MKLQVVHRYNNHHYLVHDREVHRLNQIISFYHSSWSNVPEFERLLVEDLENHQMTEVKVREIVFE